MIDLERRVVEAETLDQHALEPAPDGVAVGARLDQDVRRQRGKTTRDRPDVQVVDLDDVPDSGDLAADLIRVDLRR